MYNIKLFRPFDLLIFAGIVMLCVLFFNFFSGRFSSNTVVVEIDGEERYLFDASKFGVYEILGHDEKKIQLKISSQGICLIESDCPLKVCVKKGFLGKYPDSIICIPLHTVIHFKGRVEADSEIDVISQ